MFAAPTLAADDLVPVPEVPAIPEVDTGEPVVPGLDSAMPEVAPPPEITTPDPPITISVEAEGGNVDVEVRVLSPAEDATETQKSPETGVVSGSDAPDITPDAPSPQPSSDADADTPATGSNVNVSVRVLSPGVDDPVQQGSPTDDVLAVLEAGNPAAEEDQAIPSDSSAVPPKASTGGGDEAVQPTETEQQYQEEDSRYQSDSQFEGPTWHWLWFLSMDCDGNTASSSTETGQPSALDWVWAWDWEWACNSPPRPPPLEPLAAGNDAGPTSLSTDPAEGSSTQPATLNGDGAAGEPWLWTWTFTFCGQTTSATIPIYVQTQLHWNWDWTWDWTCEETAPAASPSPSTGTPAPPDAPSPATIPGVDQDANAPDPTCRGPRAGAGLGDIASPRRRTGGASAVSRRPRARSPSLLLPELVSGPTQGLAGGFVTSGRDRDITVPARSRAGSDWPHERDASPTWRGRVGARRTRHVRSCEGRACDEVALRRSSFEADSALPTKSPAPLPERRRSGGLREQLVPGGSSSGTAALVSFLAFFAPGLGRRMRATRELSPRGTYGSSIDRPG